MATISAAAKVDRPAGYEPLQTKRRWPVASTSVPRWYF